MAMSSEQDKADAALRKAHQHDKKVGAAKESMRTMDAYFRKSKVRTNLTERSLTSQGLNSDQSADSDANRRSVLCALLSKSACIHCLVSHWMQKPSSSSTGRDIVSEECPPRGSQEQSTRGSQGQSTPAAHMPSPPKKQCTPSKLVRHNFWIGACTVVPKYIDFDRVLYHSKSLGAQGT